MKEDTQLRFEIVDKALARNLNWIAAADTKIPAVFAIDTAMLGVLAVLIPPARNWSTVAAIISFLAAGAIISSIICLAVASFPRLYGPKGSIVYFGGIVTRKEEDYINSVSRGVTEELIEDIARQAYRNAEIAAAKYSAVRWATVLLFTSIPFWLIAVAVLYNTKAVYPVH